jgi:hypothetical protein
MEPLELVEARRRAFNKRDIEGLCACFAANAVMADYDGQVANVGLAAIRQRMLDLFAAFPKVKAQALKRMEVGAVVIEHERLTNGPEGAAAEAGAIYRIAGEKIVRVDFVR